MVAIVGRFVRRVAALVAVLPMAAVLLAAAAAEAETPIRIVPPGNLEIVLNAGVAPKKLPRAKRAPVSLTVAAGVRAADGSHPSALEELAIDLDRGMRIEVQGVPTCGPIDFRKHDLLEIREHCKGAIIGDGDSYFEIASPESSPIALPSRLIIINGGVKRNITTLYLLDRLAIPTPRVVLMPIEVKRDPSGLFGTTATISIPKIADRAGSITDLTLVFARQVGPSGVGVVSLECPDNRFLLRASGQFTDGTTIRAVMRRNCIGVGQ